MRWLVTFLAVAAVIGFGWVFSLPSKAECVASGRVSLTTANIVASSTCV